MGRLVEFNGSLEVFGYTAADQMRTRRYSGYGYIIMKEDPFTSTEFPMSLSLETPLMLTEMKRHMKIGSDAHEKNPPSLFRVLLTRH